MSKKLLAISLLITSCVTAMEEKPYVAPDTNVTKFVLRKTVRIVLANGHSLVWPTEAAQLAPYERGVATKLYTSYEQWVHPILARAKTVLSLEKTEEQVSFLEDVIHKLTEPGNKLHLMGYVESRDRLEGVLFSVALFCQAENPGKGTQDIWDVVLAKKHEIEQRAFNALSGQDTLFIGSLLRKVRYHEGCSKTVVCKYCMPRMSAYISECVVDTCCKDKVKLGKACDLCAKRIKRDLFIKVKELVLGLHHFGVPIDKQEHKDLLSWADIKTRSN